LVTTSALGTSAFSFAGASDIFIERKKGFVFKKLSIRSKALYKDITAWQLTSF